MVANTFVKSAAVLLAAANLASAGSAVVHNQCDFEVYLWSVSDTAGSMTTLPANGGEYTEAYQVNPDGGGISIKVGRNHDGRNVTQYEYTYEGKSLWYDLSLIDGAPFVEYGVSIVPSDDTCRAVICPAGLELCAEAYMIPSDNWATAECSSEADTVLVLCSGDEDTSGSASVTSVVSSALATASAVTVFPSAASTVEASTTEAPEPTTTKSAGTTAKSTKAVWSWSNEEATTAAAATTAAPHSDPDVVIHTTFVTYIVTVVERDASPEPTAVAKRQIHRHEHGQKKRHHVHA